MPRYFLISLEAIAGSPCFHRLAERHRSTLPRNAKHHSPTVIGETMVDELASEGAPSSIH
eukprot:9468366-Pyramimonas_sp.AAC.3